MEFQNNKLITFLKVLYNKRKFLIFHFVIISIVSVAVALSIAKTYSTSATILPPNTTSTSSILPANMTEGLGGALGSLAAGSSSGTNRLLSILHSRQMALNTIEKFDLMQRFEAENIEDALEAFDQLISITLTDESMVNLAVNTETEWLHPTANEEHNKELAFAMCTYMVKQLDSIYTQLEVEKARYERKIVEQRFEKNKKDLKKAQQNLRNFSEKYGMVALPKQVQSSVKAAAELQSSILINRIELKALEQTYKGSNSQIKQKQILIEELSESLNNFHKKEFSKDTLSILPSISNSPELIYKFTTIQRELQVQEILYEFLIQRYEQVKLDEAKQTPSLQFIDEPMMPTRKSAPARSLVVIALVSIGMLLGIAYIFIVDVYWNKLKLLYQEVSS